MTEEEYRQISKELGCDFFQSSTAYYHGRIVADFVDHVNCRIYGTVYRNGKYFNGHDNETPFIDVAKTMICERIAYIKQEKKACRLRAIEEL